MILSRFPVLTSYLVKFPLVLLPHGPWALCPGLSTLATQENISGLLVRLNPQGLLILLPRLETHIFGIFDQVFWWFYGHLGWRFWPCSPMALKLLEASESPRNRVTGRLFNMLIAEVHPRSLSFRETELEPETLVLSENLHFQQPSTDRMPLILGPPSETCCCTHTHQPASQHTQSSFKLHSRVSIIYWWCHLTLYFPHTAFFILSEPAWISQSVRSLSSFCHFTSHSLLSRCMW